MMTTSVESRQNNTRDNKRADYLLDAIALTMRAHTEDTQTDLHSTEKEEKQTNKIVCFDK